MSTVRLTGAELVLPTPPLQHAPWTPPDNLPTNLLSAVRTLFEQGFPDPRGCEYREVEVVVSDIRGQPDGPVRTRGWVLPAAADAGPRFAICWNGLIYPVRSVGSPADLLAEVANVSPTPAPRPFDLAIGEARSVFFTNGLSTRAVLLLRCGETNAALKLWQRWGATADGAVGHAALRLSPRDDFDPYLHLAEDWTWALFDRLISAFVRGDDALALATARTLAQVQPKIEAEAARRGFPPRSATARTQAKGPRYLTFLEQLPELLADLERRAAEGPRQTAFQPGVTNPLTLDERARALVRDLDQVCARQWSQPGWVDFFRDPIVVRLLKAGEAGVDALLECLESDRRLTRSVSFHRNFKRQRRVLPVSEVARVLLIALWQFEFHHPVEARAYWKRYGGLPLEERWYAILRDDAAGLERWCEAARNVVRTQGLHVLFFETLAASAPATNASARFQGESLRGKANPSVSELLARRALEIPAGGQSPAYNLATACDIAFCLAEWDARAFIPVGRKLVQRCQTVLEYSPESRAWPVQRIASYVGKLTLARVAAGDEAALADYAAWLPKVTPAQLAEYLPETIAPLRLFPTNAVLQAMAETLFSPTNSFWGQLPWRGSPMFNPVESELVSLPAFRRLLARELNRQDVCGWIVWDGGSRVSIQLTNEFFGPRTHLVQDVNRPLSGNNAALRWCDWIAWSLSRIDQIPSFDPLAPFEERDRRIEQARAILQK
ncbi:MAG: hypothetical protein N3I86_14705 [Verrucomicrobiae bacterium]|nr:hypothetical protein [Verrucomicrobiae bacterium]